MSDQTVPAKTFNQVSQFAHAFAGSTVVLGSAAVFGDTSTLKALAVVVLWAAIKEFWWDEKYEDPVTRGSSLEDFVFYLVGGFVGLLAVALGNVLS